MAEKSILAYFHSPEEAESIVPKLKALRVADLQIDRIGRYPGDTTQETFNPLTADFNGLGSLTLDADIYSRDAGILIAADPSASGMSDGGGHPVTGRDILLTVVCDEQVHEQALRLIHEAGGEA